MSLDPVILNELQLKSAETQTKIDTQTQNLVDDNATKRDEINSETTTKLAEQTTTLQQTIADSDEAGAQHVTTEAVRVINEIMSLKSLVTGASLSPAAEELMNLVHSDSVSAEQVEAFAQGSNGPIAFQEVTSSPFSMERIASLPLGMTALAGSETAMSYIVTSQVAMTAVAASQVAMTAVAASQVAMTAVAASQVAMTAVFASWTARATLFNHKAAVDALLTTGRSWMLSNVATTENAVTQATFTTFANGKNLLLLRAEGFSTNQSVFWAFTSFRHDYNWVDPNRSLSLGSFHDVNVPLANPMARNHYATVSWARQLIYVLMQE